MSRESSDPYYDLIDDFDLIVSSFQTQYGLRLSRELKTMKWDEFYDLITGLGPETPLGRIVAIRSENDKEILKSFSPDQKRIRNDWRNRNAHEKSKEDLSAFLESMKEAFIKIAEG